MPLSYTGDMSGGGLMRDPCEVEFRKLLADVELDSYGSGKFSRGRYDSRQYALGSVVPVASRPASL